MLMVNSLYQIKLNFWYLFPSLGEGSVPYPCFGPSIKECTVVLKFWEENLKYKISYLSPKTIFSPLEIDGKYIKIISTNGDIGWINAWDKTHKHAEKCFVELTKETR